MIVWQRFALDAPSRISYYGVALLLMAMACGRPGRLGPTDLPALALDSAAAWVAELTPDVALRYDLRWTFSTENGSARGRASVHFVAPDSVRFDFRAPFGRSGAAVVVGDSVVWAEPAEDVSALIGATPLFWGLLGIPRPPSTTFGEGSGGEGGGGVRVTGLARGGARLWRYAMPLDTLTYETDVSESSPRLRVELRSGSKLVGSVETLFEADLPSFPTEGTVRFPAGPAVFQLRVLGVDTLRTVDATIWKRP